MLTCTAAVALWLQTAVLLDWLYFPNWFYVPMFSNTILQYGLHDLFTKKTTTLAKPKLAFRIRNRSYFIGSVVIAALISALLFFNLTWIQIYWLLLMGVLTIAYSFPILPFEQLRLFK